jgi:iron complex transport system substrate-binding protein
MPDHSKPIPRRLPGRSLLAALLALGAASPAVACDGRLLDAPEYFGGPVCAPVEPRRIAALDPFYNLQMAEFLGLPVVAAVEGPDGALPEGAASLGSFLAPDLEALVAAKPDLVLGDAAAHGGAAEALARIAPTALIDTSDWRSYFRLVARAGGREAEAEAALGALDARVAALAVRLPEDATVSFLRILPGGFQVYVDGPEAYAPMQLLGDLGLGRPPFETVADSAVLKRIGWEGLPQLQGDVLIYVVGGGDDSAPGAGAALEAEATGNPMWRTIPAVRAGRAYRVSAGPWMAFGGVPSAEAILADVARVFGVGAP